MPHKNNHRYIDEMAGLAMQGFLSRTGSSVIGATIAERSYEIARCMWNAKQKHEMDHK